MRTSEILFASARNIRAILKDEGGLISKVKMLSFLVTTTFKLIFVYKLLGIKITCQKFSGHKISFFDYETFWGLYNEIFIQKEYLFISDKESPFIIDCGSNVGLSILYFNKVYPKSRIIAFEPHAETFEILKNNISCNRLSADVVLNNAAVNDEEGTITFYLDLDRTTTTGMSLSRRLLEKGKRLEEEKVKSVLLSDFIEGEVDFLKMDIEGAEVAVLKELSESSKLSFVKEMVIEYHYNRTNPENDLVVLLEILNRENFKYLIQSSYKPPYFSYKDKPYSLIVYAYK
jgi:FkbM family methyltransferase